MGGQKNIIDIELYEELLDDFLKQKSNLVFENIVFYFLKICRDF